MTNDHLGILSKKPRTALVVEQSHDLRVILRNHLEDSLGMQVLSEPNPVKALEALKSLPLPDVILLSTRLSLMKYEEFLSLKGKSGPMDSIPVILLAEKHLNPLPAGAAACIQIPIHLQDLSDAIMQAVFHRKTHPR